MQFSNRLVMWCVAIAVALLLVIRPCSADETMQEAEQAAHEAGHEAAVTEEGGGDPNPLAVDPDLAIWTGVVFLLLFLILSKFAWPQIAAALDERERKITDNIASAAAMQEEAKGLLAEHEAKLAAAAGEVRALLDEARRDAEVTKNRIVAEARKAGEDEKNRALLEITRAKEGAVHELATASANVAIDLARRVVQEKITPEEHAKVVRDALSKLAASNPSKN